MDNRNQELEFLLELDGVRFMVNELLGFWVKFSVKQIPPNKFVPHGIKYSLSLHDRNNNRIIGFDNAHSVTEGINRYSKDYHSYDHKHRYKGDKGKYYKYTSAAKLVEDFWLEVDKVIAETEVEVYES